LGAAFADGFFFPVLAECFDGFAIC